MEQKELTVKISPSLIWYTLGTFLLLWLLYLVRHALVLFLIAVFLTALLEPAVDKLHKKKVRRSVAVLIIFLVFFLIVGGLIAFLVPQIVREAKEFSQSFPVILERVSGFINEYTSKFNIPFNKEALLARGAEGVGNTGTAIFSTTVNIASGFISFIAVLSLAFYMSAKEDAINGFIKLVTPIKYHSYVTSVVERIKDRIGKWMQGQLLLMVLIFVLYFIALLSIGVPYALVIAIFGGLVEIIPYVGPIIALIPAVIAGLIASPVQGLLVLLAYIIIQQIENHIIVPQLMGRAVGLNPVAVILALLIGAQLGGAIGAILSVPVATAISVIVGDYFNRAKA